MHRLASLLIAAFLLLSAAASAATPNEAGLQSQLTAGGLNTNTSANFTTPVYLSCVTWRPPYHPCGDSSYQRVNFDNVNEDFSPKIAALTADWTNVPLVSGWKPAGGSDGTMVVLNYTGGGKEYVELWRERKNPANGHWTGVWGGGKNFAEMTTTPDGLRVWPTSPNHYGASASGIALVPGIVTLDDLQRGAINHPVHFAVRVACGHKSPATRDDGKCWANSVQYGAKFKLPSTVDVDAITSGSRWCAPSQNRTDAEAAALGWNPTTLRCPLPPLSRMIAKAAQTSFWIATDQQGNGGTGPGVQFDTESWDRPRAQNWANVPAGNPYNATYLGCDGIQSTGQSDAHPVTATEGWEQDCIVASWTGFPYAQLYEIP